MTSLKLRLILMNFLQFAIWGAYLTSMGTYLSKIGMANNIGLFYAIQGVVSLFMPALVGILADRWIPAQRVLGGCQLLAGLFMGGAAIYAMMATGNATDAMLLEGSIVEFTPLFTLYTLSVAFYMPTIALSNSVAYSALESKGLNCDDHFPPIRIFGTIGFICSMLAVDFLGFQGNYSQFILSGIIAILLGLYSFTLPNCPVEKNQGKKNLVEALGLKAFLLFKQKRLAIFFIFSMLLGVSLQITNGYANPFLDSFKGIEEFKDSFAANHANALISLSQISETLCILLIPFALRHFGIKKVMLIAMFAWVFRFGLFGFGDPGSGVWMFVLSMIVYGVAFDFFNISGSLFVNKEAPKEMRSSAQGLFMIMTNGIGATIGMLGAQAVVDNYVFVEGATALEHVAGWHTSWQIFACYALVVGILFAIIFKDSKMPAGQKLKH